MTHPYKGTRIAFATMHGKETLAAAPFRQQLDAQVVVPENLDTDQFGTFTGEIPRTLSPRSAASMKARLGAKLAQTPYSLASEGSFESPMGFLLEHQEILLFIDQERNLELVESTICSSPLPPRLEITDIGGAISYAASVDFPLQRLILRAQVQGEAIIDKNIDNLKSLTDKIEGFLATGTPVTLEPDLRACYCPSRSKTISTLAQSMAARLRTPCDKCRTPGFGRVDVERGLLCELCAQPTLIIAADIYGCGTCSHTVRRARSSSTSSAQWCSHCNP